MFTIYLSAILCVPLLLIFPLTQSMRKEPTNISPDNCLYWQSKVDQTIRLPKDTLEKDENDERNVIEAIDCLLKLKGNATQTKYSAVVSFKLLEAKLPTPTIEIAALYKISTIYYQNRNHADAIVLMDKDRNQNTKESIELAYRAYEAWFEQVKKIGLQKAREANLDPLANSGVEWY